MRLCEGCGANSNRKKVLVTNGALILCDQCLADLDRKNPQVKLLKERLTAIAGIIEAVDNRCAAADGPVTPTLQEMTQAEISRIYELAKGVAP